MTLFLISIVGGLLLLILLEIQKCRSYKRKNLEVINSQWGKPIDKYRNFALIGLLLKYNKSEERISQTTESDLDLENVFSYIDRTTSKVGQQYLYNKLYCPLIDHKGFLDLEKAIAIFDDIDLRKRVQLKLTGLNNVNVYVLPELFSKRHASEFGIVLSHYVKLSWALLLGLIFTSFLLPSPIFLIGIIFLLLLNTVIYYLKTNKIYQYIHSLPHLAKLYEITRWLISQQGLKSDPSIQKSLSSLSILNRSLGFLKIQSRLGNDPTDVTYLVAEILKMFFLVELRAFLNSIQHINQYAEDIKTIFNYVGEIDAAISIKSFREGLPYYCIPQFGAYGEMIIENLYHPLVENCIANSIICTISKGILITGSNMSGKTTFIRSIAINALLSQTIHTSLASRYVSSPLRILTSIQISDNLQENKSYFQEEASSILSIINNQGNGKDSPGLVIIDEIFKGTNTIERIAAAKAVLSYLLEKNNFVLVSTHDLELAELLGNEYIVYSFEEIVSDKRLIFDYKLKEGLLKNVNGIAVLDGLGFPKEIIEDANIIWKRLKKKYS